MNTNLESNAATLNSGVIAWMVGERCNGIDTDALLRSDNCPDRRSFSPLSDASVIRARRFSTMTILERIEIERLLRAGEEIYFIAEKTGFVSASILRVRDDMAKS
ncbi:hypothetical protein [Burkholderia sp. Cy-637]|uniref:hypothetical protein n=1 Tax=Burkholderia sp. Cy-637 TaxID=2608327 RepID=UPI0014218B8E|nr:hypothetical protein [Burkholderia sp. Cy-637]NIF88875.1 hypothetical protein [Burkholderia sp. Cy-637]